MCSNGYGDDIALPSSPMSRSANNRYSIINQAAASSPFANVTSEVVEKTSASDADIFVERVSDTSRLLEGDIVVFGFVSENAKWMWSIGTVVAPGNITRYTESGTNMESCLVTLVCWRMTEVAQGGSEKPNERLSGTIEQEVKSPHQIPLKMEDGVCQLAFLREVQLQKVQQAKNIACAARSALRTADRKDWGALRHMQKPPQVVRLVVGALFLLVNIKLSEEPEQDEWNRMLRFLRLEALDNVLSDQEIPTLDDAQAEFITKEYLNNPLFSFDEAYLANKVTGLMHRWITSEVELYTSQALLFYLEKQLNMSNKEGQQNNTVKLRSNEFTQYTRPGITFAENSCSSGFSFQSFKDAGYVSFFKTSETTVVLRSSVFCKLILCPPFTASTLKNIILGREHLSNLFSAALANGREMKLKSLDNDVKITDRRRSSSSQTSFGVMQKAKLLHEEEIKRKQIMMQELESLFNLHVCYVNTQAHLFFVQCTTNLFDNKRKNAFVEEFKAADSRVKALEAAVWEKDNVICEKENALSEALANISQMRQMQEQLKKNLIEAAGRSLSNAQIAENRLSHLQSEEECTRFYLISSELERRLKIITLELKAIKENYREVPQNYIVQLSETTKRLSDLERCRTEAIKILDEYFNPGKNRDIRQQELTVSRALGVLRGHTFSEALPSSLSRSATINQATGLTLSLAQTAEAASEGRSIADFASPTVNNESDNVVILKDRLLEALHDREIIQDMFSREETKNRALLKDNDSLRFDIAQVRKKNAELEKMVEKLQNDILAFAEKPTRSSHVPGENANSGGTPHHGALAASEEAARLRSLLAAYEKQMSELLAEENLGNVTPSFEALRECIARQKVSCAAMRQERDVHAADAKMLESHLGTAADALEEALLQNERLQPRATKSNHTAWHRRSFPGDDWGSIIAHTPEALTKALKHDISAACHLLQENVLSLFYENKGKELLVSFKLPSSLSIAAEEIDRRLNDCAYYELEKLYAGRFALQEGVDLLKKALKESENEVKNLRATVRRMTLHQSPSDPANRSKFEEKK